MTQSFFLGHTRRASATETGQSGGGVKASMKSSDESRTNSTIRLDTGAVTVGANVTLHTGAGGGDVRVAGTLDADLAANNRLLALTAGTGNVRLSDVGATQALGALTIHSAANARTGKITVNDDIHITADEIDLWGGSNSVQSTAAGELTLQPMTDGAGIVLGAAADSGAPLDLLADELATIQDGFSSITIGRATGSHAITVDAAGVTFRDPVTIRAPGPGGSITLNGTVTGTDDASITLYGSGATTTLNADITTSNHDIAIGDGVVLGADVALSTGAGAGNIHVSGTLDADLAANNRTLTITAGTGNVDLQSMVGAFESLGTLTIVSATQVDLPNVTAGNINVTGTNIDLNGTWYTAATGDVTFTGAVDLDAASTIGVYTRGLPGDEITFAGTIDGAQRLWIMPFASGTEAMVDLQGDVGSATPLTALTVGVTIEGFIVAAQVDLADVTAGGIGVFGANIDLNGTAYTAMTNSVQFWGAIDLGAAGPVTVTSGGAAGDDITFASTVDGAQHLNLEAGLGAVHLLGDVGGTTPLSGLTVTADSIRLDGVVVCGTIMGSATTVHLLSNRGSVQNAVDVAAGVAAGTISIAADFYAEAVAVDREITMNFLGDTELTEALAVSANPLILGGPAEYLTLGGLVIGEECGLDIATLSLYVNGDVEAVLDGWIVDGRLYSSDWGVGAVYEAASEKTLVSRLWGDLNGDAWVGQADLDIVLAQWGQSGGGITDPRADVNEDDFVGQFDLDYVLADWGEGKPPTAPVPEPAMLGIFALCGFAVLRRKPKSR